MSLIDQIRMLEASGVLGTEDIPTSKYWRWAVLKPELLPERLRDNFNTYGEVRWYG